MTSMAGCVHGVMGVRLTRVHASAMMAMRQLSSTMLSENLRGNQSCQVLPWKPPQEPDPLRAQSRAA